MWYE